MVKALMALGANVHATGDTGRSALRLASLGRHTAVVRMLAERVAASAAALSPSPAAERPPHSAASAAAGASRTAPGPARRFNHTRPKVCAECGSTTPRRADNKFISCGRCVAVRYCNTVCQARHWLARHSAECVERA